MEVKVAKNATVSNQKIGDVFHVLVITAIKAIKTNHAINTHHSLLTNIIHRIANSADTKALIV